MINIKNMVNEVNKLKITEQLNISLMYKGD